MKNVRSHFPAFAFGVMVSLLSLHTPATADDFLRGDANLDGKVSLADEVTIQRFLFAGQAPPACRKTCDTNDDGLVRLNDQIQLIRLLFDPRTDGWSDTLPAPFPEPGPDPTEDELPCDSYEIVSPSTSETEIVELVGVSGAPGDLVEIPIQLTNAVEVDGLQLVIKYDPDLITPEIGIHGIRLGPYWDRFENDGSFLPLHILNARPEEGVLLVALVGNFAYPGYEIVPGSRTTVGYIPMRISESAEPGTTVVLEGTNGEDGDGTGPFGMKNEAVHRGEARYISVIPKIEPAFLQIVADLTFFRGDANGDDRLDIADPQYSLNYLFSGGPDPVCLDAADANDDGQFNISDPVATLMYLFGGLSSLPAPHPEKGRDATADDVFVCVSGSV